ncbi:MAG: hypothetical protein LC104_18660 [Bacteroidales bacterium]|nr:hypothetical protein [Bacteroidales bacterium]
MRTFLLLAALTWVLGCDAGRPEGNLPPLVPVKIKVVKAGKAVTSGNIRLVAEPPTTETSNYLVSGDLGSEGFFDATTVHALSMKTASGVPPGTYIANYSGTDEKQSMIMIPIKTPVQIVDGITEVVIDLSK